MILLGIHPSVLTLILYLILCAGALHFNKDEEAKRGVSFVLAALIVDIFLNLFFRGLSLSERFYLLLQAISLGGTLFVVVKSSFIKEPDSPKEEPILNEESTPEEENLFLTSSVQLKLKQILEGASNSVLIKGDYGSGRSALARHIAKAKSLNVIEELEEFLDNTSNIVATAKTDYKYPEAFSTVIEIPVLGASDRVDCFKFFLKNYSSKIDWKGVAEITEGRVLRDIKKTCEEALMYSRQRDSEVVEPQDLAQALETLLKAPA